jgi:hypothetical protein
MTYQHRRNLTTDLIIVIFSRINKWQPVEWKFVQKLFERIHDHNVGPLFPHENSNSLLIFSSRTTFFFGCSLHIHTARSFYSFRVIKKIELRRYSCISYGFHWVVFGLTLYWKKYICPTFSWRLFCTYKALVISAARIIDHQYRKFSKWLFRDPIENSNSHECVTLCHCNRCVQLYRDVLFRQLNRAHLNHIYFGILSAFMHILTIWK